MARIVNADDYEWNVGGHKPEIYPYDEWTDEKARVLTRGEDFDPITDVKNVPVAIRKGMAKRGYKLRSRILSEDDVLIQAYREK